MDHDLTRRAEQAALGAMIADRQLAARLGYLEPEDFTDPRRRWVFRTVRQLSVTQQTTPGNWRDLIAKTAGRWVTRKYLDELVAACPDPAHGPAYGAMLVQAAVYRQARDHADQMDAQAALLGAEGSRLSEASAPGAGQAAGLGALLAEVARAVRGHTAVLAPAAPDPAAGPRPGAAPAEPAGPAPATLSGAARRTCPVGGAAGAPPGRADPQLPARRRVHQPRAPGDLPRRPPPEPVRPPRRRAHGQLGTRHPLRGDRGPVTRERTAAAGARRLHRQARRHGHRRQPVTSAKPRTTSTPSSGTEPPATASPQPGSRPRRPAARTRRRSPAQPRRRMRPPRPGGAADKTAERRRGPPGRPGAQEVRHP